MNINFCLHVKVLNYYYSLIFYFLMYLTCTANTKITDSQVNKNLKKSFFAFRETHLLNKTVSDPGIKYIDYISILNQKTKVLNKRDLHKFNFIRLKRETNSSESKLSTLSQNLTRTSSLNRNIGNKSFKNFSNNRIKTVTILGLFELTQNGTVRKNGLSEKFAAELALHDINHSRILNKYRLVMLVNDTKCDAGVGVDAFFHALYTKKSQKIISLLGTACSEVTERLAKIVPYWNMIQVSFGSTSPSLSDRKEFPLFYRTVTPISSHNEAIIALIHHFQWDTVTFFTENQNRFTMPANFLVTDLEKSNVTCKATLTFSLSDLSDQLQQLKELDSRIIIASFSSQIAPVLFCEVYKLGLYRDYAWILVGKPEESWWEQSVKNRKNRGKSTSYSFSSYESSTLSSLFSNFTHLYDFSPTSPPPPPLSFLLREKNIISSSGEDNYSPQCTYRELSETIENTILVDRHNIIVEKMSSLAGMDARQFRSKFQMRNLVESPYAPETYDAVWTIALALKNMQESQNVSLENFEYNNTEFSASLMKEMSKLVFIGISGPISFSGSDRVGVTSFMQIHKSELKRVGLYFPRISKLDLNCSGCSEIQWHGNQVPIARREFRFKVIGVDSRTYFVVAFVATGGILMAISFLAFNLYNRKLKYIKLSSPRLNNMVIIGCIFAYVAVILLGFGGEEENEENDKFNFAFVCTVRAYLLSMGFSLAFGAMFAKTYRVHRIFTRSCIGVVKNKLLRDRQLMTLIMALLLFDSVIISFWAIFDPMQRSLRNLTLEIDPSDRSVVYQTQIKVCHSTNGHVFMIVLYGYKSLLLVVGLYMAWETRHVKIQVLNDSKYIGLCVYIVVLTSVLAVSLANLLSQRVTLSFISVTSLIITSTTVTLCLLFIPKIHAIVKKRHIGDPVVESSGLKIEFNTRRFMVEDTKELLFRAEVQNRVYKRQIEAINNELYRMEKIMLYSSTLSLRADDLIAPSTHYKNVTHENDRSCSPDSCSSEEIYTVYLHHPKFILPLSLTHFQNRAIRNIEDLNSVSALGAAALKCTPKNRRERHSLGEPLAQFINERGIGFMCIGEREGRCKFKSEPKLVGGPSELQLNVPTLNLALASDSSSIFLQKGSNESCISSITSSGSRRSILSVLKLPFSYMSGFLRPVVPPQSNNDEISIENESSDQIAKEEEEEDNLLKCSSVPELWAVRSEQLGNNCKKKNSKPHHGTNLVLDSSSIYYPFSSQEQLSLLQEDPFSKIIQTNSDESPFL